MRARDLLKRRVDLVLEKDRYKRALLKIVSMKDDVGTDEVSPRELPDAVRVAEYALRKVRP